MGPGHLSIIAVAIVSLAKPSFADGQCVHILTRTPDLLDLGLVQGELATFNTVSLRMEHPCIIGSQGIMNVIDRGGAVTERQHRFVVQITLTRQFPGATPISGTTIYVFGAQLQEVTLRAATRLGEMASGSPRPTAAVRR